MIEETMALRWAHPQVCVDIGVLSWVIPKAEFYTTLRRLTDAGFGKRILFGSDQMVWPEALEIAIKRVDATPFLSPSQKRDIFYNNAKRWLRT